MLVCEVSCELEEYDILVRFSARRKIIFNLRKPQNTGLVK